MAYYLFRAFIYHWNLLFFTAGTIFGMISGYPDIIIPVVAAAEVIYLACVSSSKRFQSAIDEEKREKLTASGSNSSHEMERIMNSIHYKDRQLFEDLRLLCVRLMNLAPKIEEIDGDKDDYPELLTILQEENIDRLLWIYLKLLYTKNALDNYFTAIDPKDINDRIRRTKHRLEKIELEENSSDSEKLKNSLSDTLESSKKRLNNYKNAKKRYEFIGLELERLYSKIAGIAEAGITTRQDTEFISSEIDVVSESARETELIMTEMDFIKGFDIPEKKPPRILDPLA